MIVYIDNAKEGVAYRDAFFSLIAMLTCIIHHIPNIVPLLSCIGPKFLLSRNQSYSAL